MSLNRARCAATPRPTRSGRRNSHVRRRRPLPIFPPRFAQDRSDSLLELAESRRSDTENSAKRKKKRLRSGEIGAAGGIQPFGGDRLDELVCGAAYSADVLSHCTRCTFVITFVGNGPPCWIDVEGNHGGANPARAVKRRSNQTFSALISAA